MILIHVLIVQAMVSTCCGNISTTQAVHCKPCHCKTSSGGIIANCTGSGLSTVPKSIPRDAKVLLLNNNNLQHLSKGLFKKFNLLEHLDISSCQLTSMDVSSFLGLTNLKILILADNRLLLNNHTYPQGLFRSLQNLKVMDVSRNDNSSYTNATYSLTSFSELISLETLFIDGLEKVSFGEGFEKLQRLTQLSLSGKRGYCFVKYLKNSSFKHLPRLRHLDVSYCKIIEIENNTFGYLRHIETLDLSYNRYLGFDTLGEALYGLRHSPLKILDISYIVNYFKLVDVQVKHLYYLNQTRLKVLHLNGNGIQTFGDFVPTLLSHLTHLYIRSNRLLSGLYLFGLDPLKSLQFIDMSHGHPQETLPFLPQVERKRPNSSRGKRNYLQRYVPELLENVHWTPKLMIPMPQNVKSINASFCYVYGTISTCPISPNNVTSLDFSFNMLTALTASCPSLDKLEFLDLSNNYVSNLTSNFLMFAIQLRVLNFSHNYLAKVFRNDKEGLTFINNTRLRILRIALNSIQKLSEPLFQNLHQLEILDVNKNELTSWKPKINHMTKLSFLDISGNRLEEIPLNLRNDINEITTGRAQPLQVRISGNTLMCDCSHLQYLHWLQTADINVTDLSSVQCKFWNGDMVDMDPIEDLLMDLHKHCNVVTPIIFGTIGGIIVFLIILSSGIVYRYRWKLRYLYYTTKRKHKGYQRLAAEDEDAFVYDAFISHADEDRGFVIDEMRKILEDTFGLKLCIHHRDFIVGQAICENIINAIQTSRKTIVILSPDFVKSAWCDYEVNMAKLEGIHSGRNVICVVMYKDVPDRRQISSDLLREIAHGTYIEYPEEIEGKDLFWNSLKDAISSRG